MKPTYLFRNFYPEQKKTWHVFLTIVIFCLFTSCKKFVEIGPPATQLVSATVFTTDVTATAAITGIYSTMVSSSGNFTSGSQSIASLTGMTGDEFINYVNTTVVGEFYTNSLDPTNANNLSLWEEFYRYIYDANAVLEGLSNSTGVTASTKQQLQGEALFIRSFCFFYLTNLYGDIPLITTTNYLVNDVAGRIPQSKVYQQIVTDLLNAQNLLSDSYVTTDRIRPNKSTATALLARVYLYTQDWQDAATQATAIINDSQYSLTTLSNAFLKDNSEAIWQIQPIFPSYDTFDGSTYILSTTPLTVSLTNQLVNSFESGDNRKTSWVGSIVVGNNTYYFPYKYKVKTGTGNEYYTVFRLAEQYLILAEAMAQLNNIPGSQNALNAVRNRAGLANTVASTTATLLPAIAQERKVELFAEWGHRWLDLKRTNSAITTLSGDKGVTLQAFAQLYPIPQADINNDPNLTQNTGY